MNTNLSVATLGGGCFWCLEAVFERLAGVVRVESGYCGGTVPDPSYRAVCEGQTGHAEVVRITFDAAQLPYRDVLAVFFAIHDPTTPNRQGHDVGTQYRSVIFTHSPDQERTARDVIATLTAERAFAQPIVTELAAAPVFYRAEDAHQHYFATHPNQPYCQAVVAPKVAKFLRLFSARVK